MSIPREKRDLEAAHALLAIHSNNGAAAPHSREEDMEMSAPPEAQRPAVFFNTARAPETNRQEFGAVPGQIAGIAPQEMAQVHVPSGVAGEIPVPAEVRSSAVPSQPVNTPRGPERTRRGSRAARGPYSRTARRGRAQTRVPSDTATAVPDPPGTQRSNRRVGRPRGRRANNATARGARTRATREQQQGAAHAAPAAVNGGEEPMDMTPDQRLQAYLIRQQRIAGIPPEQMIMMRDPEQQGAGIGVAGPPPIVQITPEGVITPNIEPARFNGSFHPFPSDNAIDLTAEGPNAHNQEIQGGDAMQVEVAEGQAANGPGVTQPMAAGGSNRAVAGSQTVNELPVAEPVVPGGNNRVAAGGQTANSRTVPQPMVPGDNDRAAEVQMMLQRRAAALNAAQNGYTTQGRPLPAPTPTALLRLTGGMHERHLMHLLNDEPRAPYRRSRWLNQRYVHHLLNPTVVAGSSQRPAAARNASASRTRSRRARNDAENKMRSFDILDAFFLYHPGVVFQITSYLDIQDLLNLYSISKSFYRFVGSNLARFILTQAAQKAPDCAHMFTFRCYRGLSTPNSISKQWSGAAPRFKWLSMICYREGVVKDIMRLMAEKGSPLPEHCELVIKKIWFLMDIPENARRHWTVENKKLWPDIDIFFAIFFFVKLEMILQHRPVLTGRQNLRRMLMAQPTFTLLRDTLSGTAMTSSHELIKEYVRWRYNPLPNEIIICGIVLDDIGSLQFEGYDRRHGANKLQRPDQLLLREVARRQLDMQSLYMEVFLNNNPAVTNAQEEPSWVDEGMNKLRNREDWEHFLVLD